MLGNSMQLLMAFGTILGAVLGAALIIASGQVLLAVREIALNTRARESTSAGSYGALEGIARLNNLLGWLVGALGVLAGCGQLYAAFT